MSLRQHKELGHQMDSQGSRFTGRLKTFASTRSHRLPGGAHLPGVRLFSGSDFTREPDSHNRLSEFSNSLLDGLMVSKNISEVKKHHGKYIDDRFILLCPRPTINNQ
jgi:hypothetical protein